MRVCNGCGVDTCYRWSVDLVLRGWLCQSCTRPQRVEMGLWGKPKAYKKEYDRLMFIKFK